MSISEIQFVKIDAASSGSFGSDVGAHSVLLLWQFAYTTSGATISTSSPTFDSVSGAGPVKAMEAQSPGGDAVYGVLWVLPPPSGGWPSSAGPLATTVTNGNVDDNVAMFIAEFAVTGNSLIVDTGASPNPATGAEASGDLASGSTGDITTAPELILGMGVGFGFDLSEVGAPWTELRSGSDLCVCGYQVAASSGGSYSYDPAGSNAGWVAGAVALKSAGGGTPHTATAALTVTPALTAAAGRGRYRAAALTVTPALSAARAQAHARTAALTVTPSFSAVPSGGAKTPGSWSLPLFGAAV
jgi:hypothetical protein